MKKSLIVVLLVILSITTTFVVETEAYNKQSNEMPEFPATCKENQQLFGYFMVDLYHKEILKEIQSYYKDSTVNGYQSPWWKKHDMVSITQANSYIEGNENNRLSYSYVLKILLLPTNKEGFLGTDTLYFAVEPRRITMKNVPKELPPIKLIKYEHKEPPKTNE